jgi:hypothetical protein
MRKYAFRSLVAVGMLLTATPCFAEQDSAARGLALRALQIANAVANRMTPIPLTIPQISGTPTVGQTLTVSPPSWTGTPTTITVQWTRGGTPISGATGNTYALVSADASGTIGVSITATNSIGNTTVLAPTVTVAGTSQQVAMGTLDFSDPNQSAFVL